MALTASRSTSRIADINVTPMADVMIVLLIIFMVTLPIINEGPVPLRRLPDAATAKTQDQGPIVISIAADSTVYLGLTPAVREELAQRVREALEVSKDRLVHVKADAGLPYSEVWPILDVCRRAGAEEVAFITTPRPRG